MTNEEALADLVRFVELKTTQTPAFLSVVVEALKKQIPKETTAFFHNEHGVHHCPDCGARVESTNITFWQDGEYITMSGGNKFCHNCGKHLKWSDDV